MHTCHWCEGLNPCRYLRVDSEDHNFVLTEPPLNPPENRETAAEIMFETFNVPGLHIGVQAVLALYAAFAAAKDSGRVRTPEAGCNPAATCAAVLQNACKRHATLPILLLSCAVG